MKLISETTTLFSKINDKEESIKRVECVSENMQLNIPIRSQQPSLILVMHALITLVQWQTRTAINPVVHSCRQYSRENNDDYRNLRPLAWHVLRLLCMISTPYLPTIIIQNIFDQFVYRLREDKNKLTVRKNETSSCSDPPSASAIVQLNVSTLIRKWLSLFFRTVSIFRFSVCILIYIWNNRRCFVWIFTSRPIFNLLGFACFLLG